MRAPTEYELENLLQKILIPVEKDGTLKHYAVGYDPVAAKAYYERTKKLKGRSKAAPEKIMEDDPRWDWRTMGNKSRKWQGKGPDPRKGKTREQIAKQARATQRKELTEQIDRLNKRIDKLDALIKEREAEERQSNQKSTAKKERAAKEAAKPDSAAEKAEKAREAEDYREKNQQKLKNDGKKSGGGSSGSKKKGGGGKKTVSELRTFRTKLKGQVAVAKQKLAAL